MAGWGATDHIINKKPPVVDVGTDPHACLQLHICGGLLVSLHVLAQEPRNGLYLDVQPKWNVARTLIINHCTGKLD